MRTGDGALAKSFDRMLFLTATPFQLGHHELVRVLERFGDVRWDDGELGDREGFQEGLKTVGDRLNESQRASIAFERSWRRLRPGDADASAPDWWKRMLRSPRDSWTHHQHGVLDAFEAAKRCRDAAQAALRPWIVRHNKGAHWAGTDVLRRHRVDGAAIDGDGVGVGLSIPEEGPRG